MSDRVLAAAIAALAAMVASIPPTLAALAALIASLRNGRKSDEIHVIVNGQLERLKQELRDALAEVRQLKAALAKRRGDSEEP